MIFNGKVIPRRGSNKKYLELDDVDMLYERVRKDGENPICITDLAKELGVPQNSIRHRLRSILADDQWKNVYHKRARHKRRVTKKHK